MNSPIKTLAEVLNIDDITEQTSIVRVSESSSVKTPVIEKDEDKQEEDDFEFARKSLRNLIKKGEDHLDHAISIADEKEESRATEVVAAMLDSVRQATNDLMELHDKKQTIRKKKKEMGIVPNNNKTTNNTTIFVGTTAELQKMIKEQNSKQLIDVEAKVIEDNQNGKDKLQG